MPKNPTQSNKLKTPKLRFPGFDGVWEEKKFGDIYRFLKTNSFSRAELNEEGEIINIHYGDIHKSNKSHFDISKEKLSFLKAKEIKGDFVKDGDLIIADASEDRFDVGKTIEVLNIGDKKVVSGLHTFLARPSDKILGFSGFLMRTENMKRQFWKIATGASVLGVSKTEVEKIKINLPQLPEQQKIASFLSGVDAWVENLREQKKSLESYKKSLMQKIFSQEIRFKDENGNDFPEWEEKRLGEVCEMKNGYTFESSNYDNNGKYKIITIGNVQNGFLSLDKTNCISILPKDIQRHQILNISDLLISMTGNVGRVCLVNEENCLLNQRVGKIVSNSSLVNNDFIYQKLNTKEFEFKMQSLAQGGAQGNISKGDILGFKLQVPSIPEQQKIAEFLSSIDTLLESKQQQITKAEEWKKGLMQNLFV